MGFLKKIFGGGGASQEGGVDPEGFFMYARCDHCGTVVRLRVTGQFDLNRTDDGFTWYKTIVDGRCFRPMPAVVHFDRRYRIVSSEIEGGQFVSEADFPAS